MNYADEIKQRLPAREMFEFYGFPVNRGGFACCPFHGEKTPSCKVCVFCDHCNVFWDYTNGPYLFLCDADCNTEHGLSGQCEIFKELEQEVSDNG